jgi:CheY-like chemotaxis protein
MPNARKILIVDDDPQLRDALTEQLSPHEEFEAVAAENCSKGVQAAKTGQIDLVIMDVGLPDIDGREAVRILRKNGFKAPIIMLTGHDTDSDTILGLESGANDYVTKPFRFAVPPDDARLLRAAIGPLRLGSPALCRDDFAVGTAAGADAIGRFFADFDIEILRSVSRRRAALPKPHLGDGAGGAGSRGALGARN